MRLGVAAAVIATLALAARAPAMNYIHYPDSGDPAWLSNGLIRFGSNLDAPAEYRAYVVAPDGSGLRIATAAEAAATPASPPPGEQLSFDNPFAIGPMYLNGRVIQRVVWAGDGAALSPDGKTVVFAEWTGWVYSEGYTLYAAPVDGSAQPVRLTPDSCTLSPSTHSSLAGRCLDGTDGPDRIVGTKGGDIIIAGSGNDVIRAGDGQNIIQAQWGDDDIRTGSGPDFIWGGDGNDTIRTGAGSDSIDPGPGNDVVYAGSGSDHIVANDGQRDVIDCGPGVDWVRADRFDVTRHCEHVNVTSPQPEPMLSSN